MDESRLFPNTRHRLLQFRALHLGFLQDGDVGVGVFSEGEEVVTAAGPYVSASPRSGDRIAGNQNLQNT
jgi:hypothetical protein